MLPRRSLRRRCDRMMWKMWLSNTLLVTWICYAVSRVSRLGETNQPFLYGKNIFNFNMWLKVINSFITFMFIVLLFVFCINFSLTQYTSTNAVSTTTYSKKAIIELNRTESSSTTLFSYAYFLHLHVHVCLISLSALSHSGWTPLWVHRPWEPKPRPFLLPPCTCITARPRGNTPPQGQPTHSSLPQTLLTLKHPDMSHLLRLCVQILSDHYLLDKIRLFLQRLYTEWSSLAHWQIFACW